MFYEFFDLATRLKATVWSKVAIDSCESEKYLNSKNSCYRPFEFLLLTNCKYNLLHFLPWSVGGGGVAHGPFEVFKSVELKEIFNF